MYQKDLSISLKKQTCILIHRIFVQHLLGPRIFPAISVSKLTMSCFPRTLKWLRKKTVGHLGSDHRALIVDLVF